MLQRQSFWLLLSCGMLAACSEEKQKETVLPAVQTAQAMQHLSKLWDLTYATGHGQASAILPDGVRVTWVDSTLADWDGMEYYVDFGKRTKSKPYGVLCRDAYYRSGIYRVLISGDNWMPGLNLALNMNGRDSCSISNGINTYYLHGRLLLQLQPEDVVTADAAFSITNQKQQVWLEAKGSFVQSPVAGAVLPACDWSGNGSLRSELWQYLWDTDGLKRNMEESGSFRVGKLRVWNAETDFTVEFDPYGNEANDLWMKIWQGRREFLFELD